QHRHAVRLHAAVAAAFAHQIVDENALGRVGVEVALAAEALLRRTGLIVDDDAAAWDLAHLALHAVVVVAMVDLHVGREAGIGTVFLRLVGHDDALLDTLG